MKSFFSVISFVLVSLEASFAAPVLEEAATAALSGASLLPKRVLAKETAIKLSQEKKKEFLQKDDFTKKPAGASFVRRPAVSPQGTVVEKVLVQIGERMISLIDLKNFQKQLKLGLVPSSLLLQNSHKKSRLLKDKKLLLAFMTTRDVLYQTAQKEENPLTPSSEDVEKALARLRGALSHKKFAARLKAGGLSLKSLRELVTVDLTNDALLSRFVLPRLMVSEKEIEARHFKQYRRSLFRNFEYDFVSVRFSEDKKSRVLKTLAEQPPSQLEDMAGRFHLETKNMRLKDRDIHKLFKTELKKLSVSQISPVILLGGNYYILQLKWKTPIISPKEKNIRDRLAKQIHKEKLKAEILQWVREKQAGFFIKQHAI